MCPVRRGVKISNLHVNKNKTMITEKFKASKRHETESSEINPSTYDRLIFKAIYWTKNIFNISLKKRCWTTVHLPVNERC